MQSKFKTVDDKPTALSWEQLGLWVASPSGSDIAMEHEW